MNYIVFGVVASVVALALWDNFRYLHPKQHHPDDYAFAGCTYGEWADACKRVREKEALDNALPSIAVMACIIHYICPEGYKGFTKEEAVGKAFELWDMVYGARTS